MSTSVDDYQLIARVTHEAVRSYSAHYGYNVPPMWSELSSDAREAVLQSCMTALSGITKSEFHNYWVTLKVEQGWTYGSEFCLSKKEHPALMHYSYLTEAHRIKNEMFWTIARATAHAIGIPVADAIRDC